MQITRTAIFIALVIGQGCSHANQQTDRKATLAGRELANNSPNKKKADAAKISAENGEADQGAYKRSVYFPFDSAQIDEGEKPALQTVARQVKAKDGLLRVEGNCDERGTTEYNLALGDRRARAAAEYLELLGVAAARIDYVSYGSERPKDAAHNEAAWARNRRDDIFLH